MWMYEQPVKIIFGNGEIKKLNNIVKENDYKRGILVTSKFFIKSGLAKKLLNDKSNKLVEVFGEVLCNPTISNTNKCAEVIRENNIDFILALGGGSVIDCAKAAGAFASQYKILKNYNDIKDISFEKNIPIIAIPTTSGTGSEVTCVSVITDEKDNRKFPIVSTSFYPKVAIIDPELTYTLKANVTASTGIDILCHAIEGYWSKNHQPICDVLAIHSAKLVFEYLERAYKDQNDAIAREKLSEASTVAGLAFTLPKTTSSHACSFLLTSKYNIPHGEACGLTIDYFTRFNGKKDERVKYLANSLGFKSVDDMADRIYELKRNLGLLVDLKHLNLKDEDILELIESSKVSNLYNNPININNNDLLDLYSFLR